MSFSPQRLAELERLKDHVDTFIGQHKNVIDAASSFAQNSRQNVTDILKDTGTQVERHLTPLAQNAGKTFRDLSEKVRDEKTFRAIKNFSRTTLAPQKNTRPAAIAIIGLSVVTFASIAFALWQTLRAEDELWVSDEDADTLS